MHDCKIYSIATSTSPISEQCGRLRLHHCLRMRTEQLLLWNLTKLEPFSFGGGGGQIMLACQIIDGVPPDPDASSWRLKLFWQLTISGNAHVVILHQSTYSKPYFLHPYRAGSTDKRPVQHNSSVKKISDLLPTGI